MIENLKKYTLLYVEDELNVQLQFSLFFSNLFKEVYVSSDGEDGFNKFKDKHPDVIILDVNIPKINGIELTKKIKKIAPNVPIVLLTARSDKETLKNAIELKILSYLEKPVSRNRLNELLIKLSKELVDDNILILWENEKNNYYKWNKKEKLLYLNTVTIKLTKKENLLLTILIEKKNICTYQDIYEYVWENAYKDYNESTIKTLLSSLKSKLPKNSIINHYGIGYSINV